MRKHIMNIAEVELQPRPPQFAPTGRAAERYEARVGMIAPKIGAKKLGYNLTAVPPGKRAYPFHSHRVQEEMFYVIEGTGEVRIGGETFPIGAGDIIACPTGGPETAHQIVNTGKTELRYLSVSTKEPTEICEYPD
ncbi:MAG TPA: cupin domain-containing protein, partial [Burkholderiales bacterium]|nr:cupin domain-containing protein [Burkholderiales bacterium]